MDDEVAQTPQPWNAVVVRLASTALALFITACTGSSVDLLVELRTDIRPGFEFTSVRTSLLEGAEGISQWDVPVTRRDDFVTGVRIAEMRGLSTGSRRFRVELLDLDGETVTDRTVVVELTESRGITVVMTRDCRGIECPRADGDPSASECLAGGCVTPDCLGGECAAGCAGDGSCAAGSECTEGQCANGVCFVVSRDSVCPAGSYCDPDRGCVGEPVTMDGGPSDAGVDVGPDTAREASVDSAVDSAVDSGPDACTGECVADEVETEDRACGCGGTESRSRTCDATCTWGAWSAWSSCVGSSGTCMPGETRDGCSDPCENQVCRSDCTWSGCRTRSSVDCSWEGGTNWRCCGTNMWQYCSMSCSWNTCADCSAFGCGCP